MKYAKLINGTPLLAPNPIRIGSSYVGNPPDESYRSLGWKPLYCSEPPDPPGAGRYESIWAENENAILQNWVWHEASDEDELSDAELAAILLGGEIR